MGSVGPVHRAWRAALNTAGMGNPQINRCTVRGGRHRRTKRGAVGSPPLLPRGPPLSLSLADSPACIGTHLAPAPRYGDLGLVGPATSRAGAFQGGYGPLKPVSFGLQFGQDGCECQRCLLSLFVRSTTERTGLPPTILRVGAPDIGGVYHCFATASLFPACSAAVQFTPGDRIRLGRELAARYSVPSRSTCTFLRPDISIHHG
jgi:hypothetical protein